MAFSFGPVFNRTLKDPDVEDGPEDAEPDGWRVPLHGRARVLLRETENRPITVQNRGCTELGEVHDRVCGAQAGSIV